MKKALNLFIIMLMTFSIFSVFGLINNIKSATVSNFGFEDDPLEGAYSFTSNGVTMSTNWREDTFEIENQDVYAGSKSFFINDIGLANQGFFNYTFTSGHLTNWSAWWKHSDAGDVFRMALFNKTYWERGDNQNDLDAFTCVFVHGGAGDDYYYYDHNLDTVFIGANTAIWLRNYIKINNNESVEYGFNEVVVGTPQNTSYNFSKCKIDMVVWQTSNTPLLSLDSHSFTRGTYYDSEPENDTGITDGTIYFQLYNIEDGRAIQYGDFNELPEIVTWPFVNSEIMSPGYSWDIVDGKIQIANIDFNEGQIYTFYFSNLTTAHQKFAYWYYWRDGREPDPVKKYFSPKTYNQAIYDGETYNIYLYPTDYTDGVNYSWYEDNEYIEIALNKKTYDYGETVRCKFRFKSQKMLNNGLPSYNWQFRMCKRTDVVNVVQAGTPFINYLRQDAGDFDFHNNWQNVQWQLTEYNSYGYKKYFAKYLCSMMHPYEPWGTNYNLCKIPFWCTGEEFTPEGSISANPNPCTLGQIVTISWTANNSGKVKIASPFSTDGNPNYIKSQPFEYSDATRYFNFTPSVIGNYNVELYVDGIETGNASDMPVDTLVLKVNPKTGDEGEHGQFGYGVAYLWIPSYRLVAGLDNVSIYYRTYRNDSQLFVYSPRNETTSYSTTCSNWSDNVHNFHIENWMQIGTWNVTFLAGHVNGTNVTLKSSFNVINEEGNWVQFGKNVYYDNEMFNLWLKHDYRISLTFYKNDVAQGQDIIFGKGEHDGEEIIINPQYVQPSPGFWRVEMNRINELNRIYKLAEWTCTVKPAPIETTATGIFGHNLQTFMLNIDPTIRAIIGIGLCISLLLIPLGVTMKMKRPINIPPIVYAIFFLVGVGVSYIIYLWGLEIMFFLCSMTALVLVGLYFMGKQKSAPAEA